MKVNSTLFTHAQRQPAGHVVSIIAAVSMALSGCAAQSKIDKPETKVVEIAQQQVVEHQEKNKAKLHVVDDEYVFGKKMAYQANRRLLAQPLTVANLKPVGVDASVGLLKKFGLSYSVIDNCTIKAEKEDDKNESPVVINLGNKSEKASENKILRYKGDVGGYVNYIEQVYNYHAEYQQDSVMLFKCKTETFTMPGAIFESKVDFKLKASSDVDVNLKLDAEVWKKMVEGLENDLTENGVILQAAKVGVLTVSDRPQNVRRMGAHLDKLNELMRKQVALEVKIVQYNGDVNTAFGINGSAVIHGSGENGAIIGTPVGPLPPGAGGIGGQMNGAIIDGRKVDLQAMMTSLASNTNVSLETSASLTAANGVPVPFNVTKNQNYVKSITSETEKGGGPTTEKLTYEVDSVRTGLDIVFVANTEENDKINLSVYIRQDELLAMTKVDSLQLPTTATNSSFQTMRVSSGDVVVLTGFSQNRTSDGSNTTVPGTLLLGGNTQKNKNARRMAIVIIPRLL